MMDGWDSGMGAGGWIFMALFWLALIVFIMWAVTQLLPARREPDRPATDAGDGDPETILARRLARGEIDADTYDDLRRRLAGRGSTPAGVH